jgi:hypothetical protein
MPSPFQLFIAEKRPVYGIRIFEIDPGPVITNGNNIVSGFTGVHIGLYATGNGKASAAGADYD